MGSLIITSLYLISIVLSKIKSFIINLNGKRFSEICLYSLYEISYDNFCSDEKLNLFKIISKNWFKVNFVYKISSIFFSVIFPVNTSFSL